MKTLLLLLALCACAPRSMDTARFGTYRPMTTVVVNNWNWNDARVYLIEGNGKEHWIGYVTAQTEYVVDRLVLSPPISFRYTFLANRQNPFWTYQVHIVPGDIVELTIGANEGLTHIMVVAR